MTLPARLRLYAQQWEDVHAPENVIRALREAADEIERLRAMLPRPIEEAPKDREVIGVERPPGEDRNYFSILTWREDQQQWMAEAGVDWSVSPGKVLYAVCPMSHFIDPSSVPLLPEAVFEDGDDE